MVAARSRRARRVAMGMGGRVAGDTMSAAPLRLLLLDNLGGLLQDGLGDGEPQGLSGLQVDAELEPARLLDWEVSRLRALQDLVHVVRGATIVLSLARPVVHEP